MSVGSSPDLGGNVTAGSDGASCGGGPSDYQMYGGQFIGLGEPGPSCGPQSSPSPSPFLGGLVPGAPPLALMPPESVPPPCQICALLHSLECATGGPAWTARSWSLSGAVAGPPAGGSPGS